jgi:hypothetical protein
MSHSAHADTDGTPWEDEARDILHPPAPYPGRVR